MLVLHFYTFDNETVKYVDNAVFELPSIEHQTETIPKKLRKIFHKLTVQIYNGKAVKCEVKCEF